MSAHDDAVTSHADAARRRALIGVHAAVALFGLAGLFPRWLALSPLALVLGRTVFAALALATFALAVQRRVPRFAASLVPGAVVLAVHWVTFFDAIRQSTVAVGLLGYASFPLWVLVLEAGLRMRRVRWRDVGVALIVTAGLAVLASDDASFPRQLPALGIAVLSGAAFALLVVLNRRQAAARDPLAIALWQNAAAALFLAPVLVVTRAGDMGIALPAPGTLLGLAFLGIVCTALAHTLFIAGLARLDAHVASVTAALEPVYGMLLAWALVQEVPAPRAWGAAALLVLAALLASGERRRATPPAVATAADHGLLKPGRGRERRLR